MVNMVDLDKALRGENPVKKMKKIGFFPEDFDFHEITFFGNDMFVIWNKTQKVFTCYTKGNSLQQEEETIKGRGDRE